MARTGCKPAASIQQRRAHRVAELAAGDASAPCTRGRRPSSGATRFRPAQVTGKSAGPRGSRLTTTCATAGPVTASRSIKSVPGSAGLPPVPSRHSARSATGAVRRRWPEPPRAGARRCPSRCADSLRKSPSSRWAATSRTRHAPASVGRSQSRGARERNSASNFAWRPGNSAAVKVGARGRLSRP